MKTEAWDNYCYGTNLMFEDRLEVLRSFVERYTSEHHPKWANEKPYHGHPHYTSDVEWLDRTMFAVLPNGRLDHRAKSCISLNQSWPAGKPQFTEELK